MTCPYRYYCGFIKAWRCRLAYQKCLEASIEGFIFEECYPYKEKMAYNKRFEKKVKNKMKLSKEEAKIIYHWFELVEGEYGSNDSCLEVELVKKLEKYIKG